tara:strand:+ start:332 stop:625 length:294 start_codon:yes stop_codon:yes gene_type:complete
MSKPRFRTWKYDDGAKITEEHSNLFDGEWKYGNNCYEIIFVIDGPGPFGKECDCPLQTVDNSADMLAPGSHTEFEQTTFKQCKCKKNKDGEQQDTTK